eukprot:Gb_08467 [translate_table: standard]
MEAYEEPNDGVADKEKGRPSSYTSSSPIAVVLSFWKGVGKRDIGYYSVCVFQTIHGYEIRGHPWQMNAFCHGSVFTNHVFINFLRSLANRHRPPIGGSDYAACKMHLVNGL